MIKAVVIGTGKVARHLVGAFKNSEKVRVVQVAGRNKQALEYFSAEVHTTTDLNNLSIADIYILALSDDAIGPVSARLPENDAMYVHTSGSTPMQSLSRHKRTGVFYPLQTFSLESRVNFREVPICLEAGNEEDMSLLEVVAQNISDKIYQVNSDQRSQLHLAAVFVNNYVNHLYHIGHTICRENDLPFEILRPLIRETSAKIEYLEPFEAQTGPARRGDLGTIQKQIDQLKDPLHQSLYQQISESIQSTYASEL